ncbi:MAG: DmsE family decaheme c-type cytochrome [candidate division NC10 bacterium]|nr:DmsE family decaheme c-type cytochrome [candidate division NC10 bacterium]
MGLHASPSAAGARRKGPRKFWAPLGLVGALAVVGLLLGVQVATAAPPSVPGATFIGSEQCKGCHEDLAKKMEHSLHGKLLGTKLSHTDLQRRGCEACHGPGSKHLEDPANPAFNLRFGKKSPLAATDKNAVCLQCHQRGKRILWQGSPHEARDVACATCHSVHAPQTEKGQLQKATQTDLCSQCHQVKAMQFQRSSHMPVKEGKLTCTRCHNPHGTTTEKPITAISINEGCTTCHADKRGPFLWEHAPVVESCLNCHQAHGSNNAPLMRVKQPRLCQQCHVETRHPTQPYPVNDRKVFNRSCVNCHPNIHGSNHPSGVFFTR